jgi:GalNAc-alpha-(1->4)-GalNAc-alpha-(1->3)-diNAcBac-PP-undecaprenol alpha-1,4-N-acetyl-D-galactosaminyltransferase
MAPSVTRLRIVIFVSGLGPGGAERAAVRICGWLRDAGHHVCLMTLSDTCTDFYPCPEGVDRVGLAMMGKSRGKLDAICNNIRRLYRIRRAVKSHRADVVVALGNKSNISMLLALIGVNCRKIISERGDPVRAPLGKVWDLLRRWTYPMASLHIAQSKYVSKWMQSRYPNLPCTIIGNSSGAPPLGSSLVGVPNHEANSSLKLLHIGGRTFEKGLDLTLLAFEAAIELSPVPIELIIVGGVDDYAPFAEQLEKPRLKGVITFTGEVSDIWAHLRSSDIFVLASRREGFPNALIEAMSAGIPIIAARCEGGVDDILGNVQNRYALEFPPENVEKLVANIVKLAASSELRKTLGFAAFERSKDYSSKKIAAAWNEAVCGA